MDENLHWNPINELHKFDDVYHETRDEHGRLHSFDDKPAFIAGSKELGEKCIEVDYDEYANFHRTTSLFYDITQTRYIGDNERFSYKIKKIKNNKCKIWYKHGKIHRDGDKPAVLMSVGPEILKASVWFQNGLITRNNDKPAITAKVKQGLCGPDDDLLYIYIWFTNGIVHRHKLPAVVMLYDNLNIYRQIWITRGKLRLSENNERVCSLAQYNSDGTIQCYTYGAHSEDLYNMEGFYDNSEIHHIWIETPQLELSGFSRIILDVKIRYHRFKGPAIIIKDLKGNTLCERFWIHGKYECDSYIGSLNNIFNEH